MSYPKPFPEQCTFGLIAPHIKSHISAWFTWNSDITSTCGEATVDKFPPGLNTGTV